MAPCFSMVVTARRARRVFNESILKEAEKTRKRNGLLWSGFLESSSLFQLTHSGRWSLLFRKNVSAPEGHFFT